MQKVNYPTIQNKLIAFENIYYRSINKTNEVAINNHLSKIPHHKGSVLTFERLVKLNFEELIVIEPDITFYRKKLDKYTKKGKKNIRTNEFEELFNYSNNQPKIASFFMTQESLNLKVCHYCGIEYINAFTDLDDYSDGLDFVNRAHIHDLCIVKGIANATAKKLIKKREKEPFTAIANIGFSQNIRNQISSFDFKNGHNQFTLDHVFPQKTHKFYSLCLYNFVPSCYSCNSKFKKAIEFKINTNLTRISPTSTKYSFSEDFKFRLFYENKLQDIKSESEFVLQNTILRNKEHIQTYLAMFKINGRYKFHKNQILPLIENKIKYPESRIREISKETGISIKELKNIIFGKELFDSSISNQPLLKLKRDIAKKLKIKGIA